MQIKAPRFPRLLHEGLIRQFYSQSYENIYQKYRELKFVI